MENVKETRKDVIEFLCLDEYYNDSNYGLGSGYNSGYVPYNTARYNLDYANFSGCGYGSGKGDSYPNGTGDSVDFVLFEHISHDDEYGTGDGSGECSSEYAVTGHGSGLYLMDGSGSENGDGNGHVDHERLRSNIESFNGFPVHNIDGKDIIIYSVYGNYAKCGIINSDFSIKKCFIAKQGNYFAYSDTLEQALFYANNECSVNSPLHKIIKQLNKKYPDRYNTKVPIRELFLWHHIITGASFDWQKEYCKHFNIDYYNDEYTVDYFFKMIQYAYAFSERIEQLLKHYY